MPTDSAEGRLLERYRRYLLDERGLVESTVHDYQSRARLFLSKCSGASGLHLQDLTVAEVRQSSCGSAASEAWGQPSA